MTETDRMFWLDFYDLCNVTLEEADPYSTYAAFVEKHVLPTLGGSYLALDDPRHAIGVLVGNLMIRPRESADSAEKTDAHR
jgi:hypothetical protein